ncbi:head-tail adaptor protein [Mesorhizobium retamae]|uniref:Head-tail adaptor protein n=1 Tax=Mesorhizobium retamae TaxID=2912854 RepID=A0ABS9QHZ6_9HYPH|nr:head-tail adaptor protein [Mesorhizobium sp. IRAMC:0171]MCG7507064.1 head-tail adaptor protein [Mesorhizobium sp. IRAMC:0171]
MDAGRLNRRLQFSKRQDQDDGAGNTKGTWIPQFECAAGIKRLKSGEGVLAARLEAKEQIIVTVRRSANTKQITHEWLAEDMRSGAVYMVKEEPRESDDRGFFDFLAMSGVAA